MFNTNCIGHFSFRAGMLDTSLVEGGVYETAARLGKDEWYILNRTKNVEDARKEFDKWRSLFVAREGATAIYIRDAFPLDC